MKILYSSVVSLLILYACTESSSALTLQQPQIDKPAPTDSVNDSVRIFLKNSWPTSVDNRKDSEQHWISVRNTQAKNQKVLLAYAANRTKHRKYREAVQVTDRLVALYPNDIEGQILGSWLEAASGNFDKSLQSMIELKKSMDRNPKMAEEDKQDVNIRLARLIGFMQGPASKQANVQLVNQAIQEISTGLTPNQLNFFNKERERIISRYDKLVADFEKEQSEAKVASQKQKIDIQEQQVLLQRTKSDLETRRTELHREGTKLVSAENSELRRAQLSFDRARSRADSAFYDLQRDEERLRCFYRDNPNSRPPFYLLDRIRSHEYDLNVERSNADSLSQQIYSIESRIARIEDEYGGLISEIDSELKAIKKERRRNERGLEKIAKAPTTAKRKAAAFEKRRIALTTYDVFPIDDFGKQIAERLLH